jgi:hypothetical protein
MVHTLKERGDNVGAATWLRIIVAIETMRLGPSGPPRPSSRLISALAVHLAALNAGCAQDCSRSDALR